MKLRVLAAFALGLLPSYVAAQTTAQCSAGFNWAFNSDGLSPCDIASQLGGVCVGGVPLALNPLAPNFVYLGPTLTNANNCRCSSVYYSLVSACGFCQNRDFLTWSVYKTNCTTVFLQVFSEAIPPTLKVPHYAYLDVTPSDGFNVTAAIAAGGTESTALPSPTGTLPTSTGASSGLPTKSKSKTNIGAIVGGVVGGLVFLALVAFLVFFLLKKRRQKTDAASSSSYAPVHPQTPMSYAASTFVGTSVPTPKPYDPNDPSTFPTSDPAAYNGPYSSTPALSDNHYVPPNFTGNTMQSSPFQPARPHYTGAPEL